MYQWLASVVIIALAAAVLECFQSNPTMKQVLRLIAFVSLATAIVSAVVRLDFSSYAAALQRVRSASAWDAAAAEEQNRNMNRLLIESECNTYIVQRGTELGVPVAEARVTTSWDTQGCWAPERAEIVLSCPYDDTDALRDAITTELGIPGDLQTWSVKDEA